MQRNEARQEIHTSWERILPTMTAPAKRKANGRESWICPICKHGKGGDGLTFFPKSKDGNTLHCFGCGFTGDIIDLYQAANNVDRISAENELSAVIGIRIDDTDYSTIKAPQSDRPNAGNPAPSPSKKTQERQATAPQEATRDYTEYYKVCSERLCDEQAGAAARDYLKGRGILSAAIAFGAGYDPEADPSEAPGALGEGAKKKYPTPRIIIPCTDSFYYNRRIDGKDEYKCVYQRGCTITAFNEKALFAPDVQEVFITEGVPDALSVIEAGAPAIALNGSSNARGLIDRLREHPAKANIIICGDSDKAGDSATATLIKGLKELHIPFTIADINNGEKDPNESLMKDYHVFVNAVNEARLEARYKLQREEEERQRRTGAGMVDAFMEAVQTRKFEPVPTGITDIDKVIGGGFIRQQLILLGAAPGVGKTALAQWMFENMARRGFSCVYVNLEMSREQMLARSLSRITARDGHRINTTQILQGYKWNPDQANWIRQAAEEYKATIAPHMVYNPQEVTADLDTIMEYIQSEAQRAEAAGLPAPCIVIDYLQIIRGREREDDAAIIKRAVASLKAFAIEHNTFVFCIMAHNRAANKSGEATQEAGRDTSALEYTADLQLWLGYTLCMETKRDPNSLAPEERKEITLKVSKGRFGGVGMRVNFIFDGATMTYTQIAPGYMEEPPQSQTRAGQKAPR